MYSWQDYIRLIKEMATVYKFNVKVDILLLKAVQSFDSFNNSVENKND